MQKRLEPYTDAELQLLLRFASESYRAMLEATEELKEMIEAPKARSAALRSPAGA